MIKEKALSQRIREAIERGDPEFQLSDEEAAVLARTIPDAASSELLKLRAACREHLARLN